MPLARHSSRPAAGPRVAPPNPPIACRAPSHATPSQPPAGPLVPPAASPGRDRPPLVPTRALLGAAFDLLLRAPGRHAPGVVLHRRDHPRDGRSARPGALFLGTGGFLFDPRPFDDFGDGRRRPTAAVSRSWSRSPSPASSSRSSRPATSAIAVLGGRMVDRPLSTSPRPDPVAPAVLADGRGGAPRRHPGGLRPGRDVGDHRRGRSRPARCRPSSSTLVAALVGAPFAYTLAGVVLGRRRPDRGDAPLVPGLRRPRAGAAFLVVLFESVAFLLVVLGLDAGLDLVVRVFDALGLGPEAGGDRPRADGDRGRRRSCSRSARCCSRSTP